MNCTVPTLSFHSQVQAIACMWKLLLALAECASAGSLGRTPIIFARSKHKEHGWQTMKWSDARLVVGGTADSRHCVCHLFFPDSAYCRCKLNGSALFLLNPRENWIIHFPSCALSSLSRASMRAFDGAVFYDVALVSMAHLSVDGLLHQ